MSASNFITSKVERAFVTFLQAQASGTPAVIGDIPQAQVYAGFSRGTNADDVTSDEASNPLPNVTVNCESAAESTPKTGNYQATATVMVESNADESTQAEHISRAETVFNLICTDTLETDLTSALADFTVFGAFFSAVNHTRDGRKWVSAVEFTVDCCGSDF